MRFRNILILILVMITIVACGKQDENDNANKSENETNQIENNDNLTEEDNLNDKNKEGKDETEEKTGETEDDAPKNNEEKKNQDDKIHYEVNGEKKSASPVKEHNDNQGYTMSVLPEYTFTAEEPNNDVVYLTNDGNIFMRIQLLEKDVDWDYITENSVDQLKAVNDEVTSLDLPKEKFFENAVVKQTKLDKDIVTTYLIKNHDVPLKLMIFTKTKSDHTDAFLKMAETIVKD